MNNQEHNSTKSTQGNELFEKVIEGLLMGLKIMLKLIFSIIGFFVLLVIRLFKKIINYLKPHLEKLETLLYARARDFFGL